MGNAHSIGYWGQTIKFPLVPVAGAVDPLNGKLLVWSSKGNDTFQAGTGTWTETAYWDPSSGDVTYRRSEDLNHDMFCPGISFDYLGRLIVTGGNTASKTSAWAPGFDQWVAKHDMNIARGYQSSTILSTGNIFTIGGSWSGSGTGGRTGELYTTASDTWTVLNGANPAPMLTNDNNKNFATSNSPGYRNDNHAWLFGWKSGTVFQAGPSIAMNWYTTSGGGGVKSAGSRGAGSGKTLHDQMCGPAVMYDAVAGNILAVGGSPNYESTNAVTDAWKITIGAPNTTATSSYVSNGLWFPRIFANSIVLPDGSVFIVGGQTWGYPFSDGNATNTPELWSPSTGNFVQMAPHPTPRTYHSIALLMPDGTVFSGGGGLCWLGCPPNNNYSNNHFDGQIWYPPYLFNSDDSVATRPQISSAPTVATLSSNSGQISVTIAPTSSTGAITFSMIRMGSSTHTVNTDQRRAPLSVVGTPTNNVYTLQLPTDPGVALPGYWYLFVLQGGVPSVAKIMRIQATA